MGREIHTHTRTHGGKIYTAGVIPTSRLRLRRIVAVGESSSFFAQCYIISFVGCFAKTHFFGLVSGAVRYMIDGLGLDAVIDARVSRKVGRDINKPTTPRRYRRTLPLGIIHNLDTASSVMSSLFWSHPGQFILRLQQ